ncbi:MAG: hypothetical protein LBM93_00900, partial [Oscillospiraceae bacterium]|nr:hypothetical protein [Oscillospiraceae bacterium]
AELIKSDVRFRAGEHNVLPYEYISEIDNLIIYFYDKHDYFPMCNLYLMKNDLQNAKKCLKQGTFNAVKIGDFRMIKNFCKLGKYYDLFDYELIRSVLDSIDNFIIGEKASPAKLNSFLLNSGEIKSILKSASSTKTTLTFEIQTNISKDDNEGQDYISEITENFNNLLSRFDKSAYSITVSSHSPFDVIIEAVGPISDILVIGNILTPFLLFLISTIGKKAKVDYEKLLNDALMEKSKKIIKLSLENKMNEIKNMKNKYNKQEFDENINSITQSIYTDVVEIYEKDIMMIKINNKKSKSKKDDKDKKD